MLNEKGFDLWAEDYDKTVGLSDEENSYPFAGYKTLLNRIYGDILSGGRKRVLDIGFGTGVLASKLYEKGCTLYGQDFSPKMLEIAQAKMPEAHLYCKDFAQGLAAPLREQTYDAIVATYSLHHLTDAAKAEFIRSLLPLLSERGRIYIGDVAFLTRPLLEACRSRSGEEWDEEEIYFVAEELQKIFPSAVFTPVSACAGLFTLDRV